jgi:hypothetical protein
MAETERGRQERTSLVQTGASSEESVLFQLIAHEDLSQQCLHVRLLASLAHEGMLEILSK